MRLALHPLSYSRGAALAVRPSHQNVPVDVWVVAAHGIFGSSPLMLELILSLLDRR